MRILVFSLLIFLLLLAHVHARDRGSSVQILRAVDGRGTLLRPETPRAWEASVLEMQSNDKSRLRYLSSLAPVKPIVPIASGRTNTRNPYIVNASIGTPSQTLIMIIDTSYDSSWVPCTGCIGCAAATFSPAQSTTFKNVSCGSPQCNQVPNPSCGGATCGFSQTYGGASINADVVRDTLTLAAKPIPGFTFGCVRKADGATPPSRGLLGLGRGPLSFLSQTSRIYQSTFSYCLPNYKSTNFTGSLKLGTKFQPVNIKSTPLLRNPTRPSLYYVDLTGIRVGGRVVDIPRAALAFNQSTGAGTVFDTGVQFTTLVKPAYIAVRDEFRRRMRGASVTSLGGFDTCYTMPVTVPTITFIFNGMNVTLPQDNFIIRSAAGSTSCLAMAAAADNVNSVLNVIGSFQQQNHRILIDELKSRLCVARESCS